MAAPIADSFQVGGGFKGSIDELKKSDTGARAVEVANEMQRMRQANTPKAGQVAMQNAQNRGNRQMTNYRNVWVDEKFQGTEKLTKVRWGSEAYFRLARENKDMNDIFSMGQRVVVVTARNQAVVVDTDDGVDKLDEAQVKEIFKDM